MKYRLLILLILFWACGSDDNQTTTITGDDGEVIEVDISNNIGPTGSSANDLLSAANFDELVLEIIYIENFRPTNQSIENFENFLSSRLNKPNGITIIEKPINISSQEEYSLEDIIDIEESNRTAFNEDNRIAVSGIFLDGDFSGNTENGSVLGIAYRNTSFVLFEKTIRDFSGDVLGPSLTVLESTVLNHEFGHLMGLVNIGTPLQSDHQDVENGNHCNVDDCLMRFTAETGEGIVNLLSGGTIAQLDPLCIQDLQANGGL